MKELLPISRIWAALAVAVLCACPVHAQLTDIPLDYDIPAGDLARAVDRFSKQTGWRVTYDPQLVRKKTTPALKGRFVPREALERLLSDTGLGWRYEGDDTIVLRKTEAASSMQPVQMKPVRKEDNDNASETAEHDIQESSHPSVSDPEDNPISELVVTGTNIRGIANKTVPIFTVTRDDIDHSGFSSTQQLTLSLPQNFGGGQNGASESGLFGIGSTRASNISGASGVNLRGLGTTSTLVLLDGHRVASAIRGTAVDVSLIPLNAIEKL
jgi:iron complex outermembrane recepter protein